MKYNVSCLIPVELSLAYIFPLAKVLFTLLYQYLVPINILNSLIKVVVPQSMATLHLDLVNAMNSSLFVAQSFRDSEVNPIKGIQAITYYQSTSDKLLNAMVGIKGYFKYLGIYENIF